MIRKYQIGVVQMDTRDDKEANLKAACEFIDEAAAKGAKLVSFPEVMNVISENPPPAEEVPRAETISLMAQKARQHGIYIHCGSIAEINPDGDRKYNTTAFLNPKGECIAKYRKLHTFDITLPDGTVANESERIKPGSEIVTADTELGCFGFSICYDIRFPELYRYMVLHGAQLLFTPANFTTPTGKDHWEAILRCRAIENSSYVIAAAQIGKKKGVSNSFGSTMVVDPWGTVISRARETACVIMADIDLDYLDDVRRRMPGLVNRRSDIYDVIKK